MNLNLIKLGTNTISSKNSINDTSKIDDKILGIKYINDNIITNLLQDNLINNTENEESNR